MENLKQFNCKRGAMQKITDRTHDYTGPDRCYSIDVERALIWDSMTSDEKKMLLRLDVLCEKGTQGMNQEERAEWWMLDDWAIENDIGLDIIPRNK